jgi:phospholipid-binding lipoprotein MlaA
MNGSAVVRLAALRPVSRRQVHRGHDAFTLPEYRMKLMTRLFSVLLLAGSALLTGCATTHNPDPLESLNRKTFALNEGLDTVVLKPAASAYQAVLPQPVRTGVSNVFANLGDPWSALNLLLQGRVKDGLSDLARFGTNSTVGLLGLLDVATGWGMPRHGQDFGDTLAAWGVGGGAYLVLPLFGPSDLRGTAAMPVNGLGSLQVHDVGARNAMTVLKIVDKRAQLLDVTKAIDDAALDKYLFVRDAYLQRRAARDEPPDEAAPAAKP